MITSFCKRFSQGLYVTGCATASFMTLSYMLCDSHKMEKKRIRNDYENKIKELNGEIKALKGEQIQF